MHDFEQGHAEQLFSSLHPLDCKQRMNTIADDDFQDEQISEDNEYNCDCGERNDELKFQSEKQMIDVSATDSVPLFTAAPRDVVYSAPPVLPYYHCCRHLSGLQVSVDSEKVQAGMVEKTVESPEQELSFEVFVKKELADEELRQEDITKEESQYYGSKGTMEQKNKNCKTSKLSRCESTESGRYLLKVFLPVSLGSKVPKASSMRVLPRNSSSNVNTASRGSHRRTNSSNSINSESICRSCMKLPSKKSWSDEDITLKDIRRRTEKSDSINSPNISKSCMKLPSRKSWSDRNVISADIRRRTMATDSTSRTNSSKVRFAERNSNSGARFSSSRKSRPPTQTGCLFF